MPVTAAGRSGSAPPLRFVMVGDTQGGAVVPQIVADIAWVNPDYVLFPGDLVSPGSATTFNDWDNLTAQFGDNRFMVPGNHDLPGRPATNGDWQAVFNWLPDSQVVPNIMTADPHDTVSGVDQMDYYVDLAPNVRLISVTSDRDLLPGESPTYTGYEIVGGEPQALEWFQSVMALESTQQMDHVFVMTHHPVTTMMSQVNSSIDGLTEGVGTEWWQSIAGTSDAFDGATAAALLAGHNHSYLPNHPDPHSPTAEIIAGTGGGSLAYGGVPHRKVHGFVEIVIEGGLISSTFYGDSNGEVGGWSFTEVLDTFTISENGAIPRGELARYRFEANGPGVDTSLSPLSKGIDLNLRDGVQHIFDHDLGSNVVQLDGTAFMDSKSLADHNFQVLGDLRLDLWVRAEGALGSDEVDNTLVAFGDADGSRAFPWQDTINDEIANYAYILSYTEGGHLRMAWEYHASTDVDARPTLVELVSTQAVADPNTWHNIEVLRDAETMSLRFLVDGMPLGEDLSFEHLPTGAGTGSLYIGALPDITEGEEGGIATFRGRLDDLIISSELVTLFSLGDANHDGFVGVQDLDILLANWGARVNPGSHYLGDLDGDGEVGAGDLALVQLHWGEGTPTDAVPEPGTLGLFAASLLLGKARRRPTPTDD
ncbi:metallophosphoesterase [Phycisphaeraceae bacterium D3-23]